jgi:hypothetical protein
MSRGKSAVRKRTQRAPQNNHRRNVGRDARWLQYLVVAAQLGSSIAAVIAAIKR